MIMTMEYSEYELNREMIQEIIKTLVDGECCPLKYEMSNHCPMDEYGVSCSDCWTDYVLGES